MDINEGGEGISLSGELGGAVFRTSSFCSGGGCVEVALLPTGEVAVRDGKDSNPSVQFYSTAEWRDFVDGVKNGEFDY
jgi:Domain of unknown function (DUF397)